MPSSAAPTSAAVGVAAEPPAGTLSVEVKDTVMAAAACVGVGVRDTGEGDTLALTLAVGVAEGQAICVPLPYERQAQIEAEAHHWQYAAPVAVPDVHLRVAQAELLVAVAKAASVTAQ